jgi:hypothetical protein
VQYSIDVRRRGAHLQGTLERHELAPYGRVASFTVRAPEGAQLEFLTPD